MSGQCGRRGRDGAAELTASRSRRDAIQEMEVGDGMRFESCGACEVRKRFQDDVSRYEASHCTSQAFALLFDQK